MFDIKLDRTHQMLQPYCHLQENPPERFNWRSCYKNVIIRTKMSPTYCNSCMTERLLSDNYQFSDQ